jgi:DNA mismatch endonuclease (patch repair protein)
MRDKKVTHKIMSAIHSKNTKPEIMLRKELWKRGLRFRVNYKELKGKPDIVFTRAKLAVFCDGDFWHGHNWAIRGFGSLEEELKRYNEFWANKIIKNVERDEQVNIELRNLGWFVLRFWESAIKRDVVFCSDLVEEKYRTLLNTLERKC